MKTSITSFIYVYNCAAIHPVPSAFTPPPPYFTQLSNPETHKQNSNPATPHTNCPAWQPLHTQQSTHSRHHLLLCHTHTQNSYQTTCDIDTMVHKVVRVHWYYIGNNSEFQSGLGPGKQTLILAQGVCTICLANYEGRPIWGCPQQNLDLSCFFGSWAVQTKL